MFPDTADAFFDKTAKDMEQRLEAYKKLADK
jgi:hypothetical protein